MTARSVLDLGVAVLITLATSGLALAEPSTYPMAPAKTQGGGNLMVAQATDLERPQIIKPEIIKPGVIKPEVIRPELVIKPPIPSCEVKAREAKARMLQADVVAIDHPMVFNRLGAQNVNWMMYALRHDVIDLKSKKSLDYSRNGEELFKEVRDHRTTSRDIALRPDLRPRPLVLRVAEGDYLKVRFTNLLEANANPFQSDPNPFPTIDHPMEQAPKDAPSTPDEKRILRIDDQVASRVVGFHPQGLELVRTIGDDSSYVGGNANSLAKPGTTREYCFFAPKEGAYLVSNSGAVFGGEGTSGNSGVGLFAAVTVQPKKADFYRAQVTEEELRLATTGVAPTGQPLVNYEAKYPAGSPWSDEGKSGFPVLNMVQGNRIIHGDINAVIVGPGKDGRFPKETYPIERDVADPGIARNPTVPNRLEPFREFVSVFHDENAATQSYPYFFDHPELGHTLHGVRDAFMINYGSGGIGAEIIANRLHSGPMHDCLDCAYEEFFLSSFVVGDAAMIVDNPANMETHRCQPEFLPTPDEKAAGVWANKEKFEQFCVQQSWATEAYYPHDPANVHHSYIGDFVKFRNVHSGKEQHIYHLHNHQWLFNPNDDNSNYIDAQGLGPGSGYTYEIAFGGSGNRNKTVGDAIFHCHFYPHFAQGMWYMWRNHDVFESGTRLAVSDNPTRFHNRPFGLMHGKPSGKARALPDGEIVSGTPIPAIVPLPGKGLAPMPVPVRVKPRVGDDGQTHGSVAEVLSPEKVSQHGNPGFPFWVAGVSQREGQADPVSMGSRPTTPPMDMDALAGGHDGGLPRHALAGYSAGGHDHSEITRLTAAKHIEEAKPVYYNEGGTPLEQVAMKFHAQRIHPTHKQIDKTGIAPPLAARFITNGAPPTPGAPYNDPCIDDRGTRLKSGKHGFFFGGSNRGSGEFFSSEQDLPGGIQFGGNNPRIYKGANLQLDVVFNKLGYHYPQQRILTLWEDVPALLTKQRPPEPLVLRMNTYDCARYQHTNLVPKEFYLDDYQITTPTDVIGQHIHLPKWDLTSADGGANGFNYEDGTFSPGAVRERIHAINAWNKKSTAPVPQPNGSTDPLVPAAHPYFGKDPVFQGGAAMLQLSEKECLDQWNSLAFEKFEKAIAIPGKCDWLGARTTIQRWFSDPIVNRFLIHRGLGITFTHDHLGPSTHQQLGLYATMLTEPPNSKWFHNETRVPLYTRTDGGPTTWQAVIAEVDKDGKPAKIDVDRDEHDDSHREFFLQFGDFQHAYEKGIFAGVDDSGKPINEMGTGEKDLKFVKVDSSGAATRVELTEAFRHAIHPSVRKPAKPNVFPDIIGYSPKCPGGEEGIHGAVYDFTKGAPSRPCPEAISADDVGMMVVNYRNEPVAARVYDPTTKKQAAGFAGDLSFALQTRTDRKITALNTRVGDTPYPSSGLTDGILKGDPFTPIMRVYSGDLVRVKVQGGAHEHEHNGTINGLTWLQGGSGFGQSPHSGWRNSQNTGLSEQFTFMARLSDIGGVRSPGGATDRLYSVDTSQDGMWSGVWGVLRSYSRLQKDRQDNLTLNVLPSNPKPKSVVPGKDPSKLAVGLGHVCPKGAPSRDYHVVAVLANDVLRNELGVTIPPAADGARLKANGGTLIYNPRRTTLKLPIDVKDEAGNTVGRTTLLPSGPLHDPTAIMFVLREDLDDLTGRIKKGHPVEPLVLRAAAGDCIHVRLENRLPRVRSHMPDLDGYTSLSGIVIKDAGSPSSQMTSFNNNLIRPSNHIGLHPQMVYYDLHRSDGNNVGINYPSTVPPGWTKDYEWYAGTLHTVGSAEACPTTPKLPEFLTQLKEVQFTPPPTYQITTDNLVAMSREVMQREMPDKPDIALDQKLLGQVVNTFQLRIPVQGVNPPVQRNLRPLVSGTPTTQKQKVIEQQTIFSMPALAITDQQRMKTDLGGLLRKDPRLGNDPRVDRLADALSNEFIALLNPVELTAQTKDAYLWSGDVPPLVPDKLGSEMAVVSPETLIKPQLGLKPSPKVCSFDGVEFGGSNLTPPDRIKQGQKGAVGALVVEPEGSTWEKKFKWANPPTTDVNDLTADRQKPGQKRMSRATATIAYPVTQHGQGALKAKCNDPKHKPEQHCAEFRESVLVHQKGLNLRYANGDAVQSIAAEREPGDSATDVAPEDAHDAGQMAINYGTEPMWFRFGLSPDHIFGTDPVRKEGFGGITTAYQAFSNQCCTPDATASLATPNVGDPYTPISTVYAGQELRIRALLPTGIGRATIFSLHGHNWPRDPYLAEWTWRVAPDRGDHPKGGRPADWGVPSKCIGYSAAQIGMGGQESLTPMAHFDVILKSAGGVGGDPGRPKPIPGDYLWQDHGGFGITSGLWSLVRVVKPKVPHQKYELRTPCEYIP